MGSHRSCSPSLKMAENHEGVSIHLKNTPDLKNSIHSFEKHKDGFENLKDWRGSTYMEV